MKLAERQYIQKRECDCCQEGTNTEENGRCQGETNTEEIRKCQEYTLSTESGRKQINFCRVSYKAKPVFYIIISSDCD